MNNSIAIEFDTILDLDPGDINDNHVGIDLDSIFSVASIDLKLGGINLKSGRQITVWIEYRPTQDAILIWVGYNQKLPESPILVAVPIDLTKRLNESMYVGFSAANGRGSSIHMIDSLQLKRAKSLSPIQHEAFWSENCLVCFPEDVIREEGETGLRNNHRVLSTALMEPPIKGSVRKKIWLPWKKKHEENEESFSEKVRKKMTCYCT
ncbi:hypothetical protein LXL04_012052 [Taraxacum kok-saghyz]